jgi:trehalose 6-phosphate phosphatase
MLDRIGPPPPSRDWAYFLDFDGTLVDIAPSPDAVTLPASLADTLGALMLDTAGAVALVSGRSLASIDRLFAPLVLPAAGQHGHERRNGARTTVGAAIPERLMATLKLSALALAEQEPGVLLEEKGSSFALHYRARPDAGPRLKEALTRLVASHAEEVAMLEGKYVFELKPATVSKGRAIAAFLSESPFRGRQPVFAGDDRTDEDGFALVNAAGGITIRVAQSAIEAAKPTAARYLLESPMALLRWLSSRAGD